jgi:hypothetical protein
MDGLWLMLLLEATPELKDWQLRIQRHVDVESCHAAAAAASEPEFALWLEAIANGGSYAQLAHALAAMAAELNAVRGSTLQLVEGFFRCVVSVCSVCSSSLLLCIGWFDLPCVFVQAALCCALACGHWCRHCHLVMCLHAHLFAPALIASAQQGLTAELLHGLWTACAGRNVPLLCWLLVGLWLS